MLKTAVTAAVLLVASAAQAEQFKFTYSKQDFASPEAVAQLHDRIKAAAYSHCNKQYFKARHLNQVNGCVRDVVDTLVDNIGDRRLAAHTDANSRRS